MGKRNLVRILAWENVLTALVSVIAGVGLGMLFSRLAELAAVRILGGHTGFGFQVSARPVFCNGGAVYRDLYPDHDADAHLDLPAPSGGTSEK